MEAVFRRGLHLFLYLSCTISSSVLMDSPKCKFHRIYDSSSVQASFREEVAVNRGCVTNYSGLLKQVHVINYKSSLLGDSQANVLVDLDPGPGRTRTRTLVIILNSNVSVLWDLELLSLENFDVSLFKFVETGLTMASWEGGASPVLDRTAPGAVLKVTSTLGTVDGSAVVVLRQVKGSSTVEFASQSHRFQVVTTVNLPIDDQELLTWVRNEFGNVTSFSAVQDVDEMQLSTAADVTNGPAVCELSSSSSVFSVSAFSVEDQTIVGCSTDRYDLVNRRQIHVIELLSPKKNLEDTSRVPVDIMVQKGSDIQDGNRDTLLVLVGQLPTLWRISSDATEGNLNVVTNTHARIASVHFTTSHLEVIPDVVATRKGLLTWVQDNYGPVASFSNVRVANQFTVYLAPPIPSGMSLDTTPALPDVMPTVDTLAAGRTELARGTELTCLDDRIRVTVPVELVLRHSLTPGMVTWHSTSCVSSLMEDGGLVLETNHSTCGSTVTVTSNSLAFSNEVMFLSNDVTEGSGNLPSDDEDEGIPDVVDRKQVSCQYAIQNQTRPTEAASERPLADSTSLYLDLYTNEKYERRMAIDPYRVEIGDPLFLEMGVTNDDRLNVVMKECWLGIGQDQSFDGSNLYSLTINGCHLDPTVQFLPLTYPGYRTPTPPGTVKQFSFDVPYLESKDVMTFYLFCSLSVCAQIPITKEPEIIQCSSLPAEGAPCSEWNKVNFHPERTVKIGQFRIKSRERLHMNITGGFSTRCKGNDGMLQVPPVVFAFVVLTAFVIGVILVSSIWIITKHIKVPSPQSATSSPVLNGCIQNGRLPNGEAGHELQPFLPVVGGINPNNIPHEGFYNGPEPQV